MKIEKKFVVAALFISALMIFVASIPLETNYSTLATMKALRESLDEEQKFDRLLDLLRDAETGQRGFIITGKENFLARYYSATGELGSLRASIANAEGFHSSPALIKDLFSLIDLKLADLEETINIRRTHGFEAAEKIVTSARGKHYMDDLRKRIGSQTQYLHDLRVKLRTDIEREAEMSMYMGILATFINLTLLIVLLIVMFRALQAREETRRLLEGSTLKLSESITQAEKLNRQMTISAEMLQALGSTATLQETSTIISTYCAKLMPSLSGALFLYRNSRDILEEQAIWGAPINHNDQLDPNDCWALQRGHVHQTSGSGDLQCKHYAGFESELRGRLCVPLVTQGEVIGLIYLETPVVSETKALFDRYLVDRVAEQIALALANVRLRETLRRQSIIDPLTGLFNRRYMDETLRREMKRAERKSQPLAIIVIDLDHFKNINDTFGHDAGDVVLKLVSQRIRTSIRESDLACRFGGEELVIIMSDCDQTTSLERAEGIRNDIEKLAVQHSGRAVGPITASFGIALFPLHGHDIDTVISAADQALYKSKQTGRNKITLAGT